ncbi:MAG: hypothetical protein KC615_25545, partial [Anaerolineae bacterium]|nr:hypothetical protein [Anaerolineae bacterium]
MSAITIRLGLVGSGAYVFWWETDTIAFEQLCRQQMTLVSSFKNHPTEWSNMTNPYHEANRKSWNSATERHQSHRPDLIEQISSGYNTLYAEDMALLGDVRGKSVVHLQCNNGLDTLSISKHLGASITGVDISDYAIEVARQLSDACAIPARFVRSDIFDWFDTTEDR